MSEKPFKATFSQDVEDPPPSAQSMNRQISTADSEASSGVNSLCPLLAAPSMRVMQMSQLVSTNISGAYRPLMQRDPSSGNLLKTSASLAATQSMAKFEESNTGRNSARWPMLQLIGEALRLDEFGDKNEEEDVFDLGASAVGVAGESPSSSRGLNSAGRGGGGGGSGSGRRRRKSSSRSPVGTTAETRTSIMDRIPGSRHTAKELQEQITLSHKQEKELSVSTKRLSPLQKRKQDQEQQQQQIPQQELGGGMMMGGGGSSPPSSASPGSYEKAKLLPSLPGIKSSSVDLPDNNNNKNNNNNNTSVSATAASAGNNNIAARSLGPFASERLTSPQRIEYAFVGPKKYRRRLTTEEQEEHSMELGRSVDETRSRAHDLFKLREQEVLEHLDETARRDHFAQRWRSFEGTKKRNQQSLLWSALLLQVIMMRRWDRERRVRIGSALMAQSVVPFLRWRYRKKANRMAKNAILDFFDVPPLTTDMLMKDKLLSLFGREHLTNVAQNRARKEAFLKGYNLVYYREPGLDCFVLVHGEVDVWVAKTTENIGQGESKYSLQWKVTLKAPFVLGSIGMVTKERRNARLTCRTDCICYVIDHNDFVVERPSPVIMAEAMGMARDFHLKNMPELYGAFITADSLSRYYTVGSTIPFDMLEEICKTRLVPKKGSKKNKGEHEQQEGEEKEKQKGEEEFTIRRPRSSAAVRREKEEQERIRQEEQLLQEQQQKEEEEEEEKGFEGNVASSSFNSGTTSVSTSEKKTEGEEEKPKQQEEEEEREHVYLKPLIKKPGEYIIKAGQRSSSMFLLMDGKVDFCPPDEDFTTSWSLHQARARAMIDPIGPTKKEIEKAKGVIITRKQRLEGLKVVREYGHCATDVTDDDEEEYHSAVNPKLIKGEDENQKIHHHQICLTVTAKTLKKFIIGGPRFWLLDEYDMNVVVRKSADLFEIQRSDFLRIMMNDPSVVVATRDRSLKYMSEYIDAPRDAEVAACLFADLPNVKWSATMCKSNRFSRHVLSHGCATVIPAGTGLDFRNEGKGTQDVFIVVRGEISRTKRPGHQDSPSGAAGGGGGGQQGSSDSDLEGGGMNNNNNNNNNPSAVRSGRSQSNSPSRRRGGHGHGGSNRRRAAAAAAAKRSLLSSSSASPSPSNNAPFSFSAGSSSSSPTGTASSRLGTAMSFATDSQFMSFTEGEGGMGNEGTFSYSSNNAVKHQLLIWPTLSQIFFSNQTYHQTVTKRIEGFRVSRNELLKWVVNLVGHGSIDGTTEERVKLFCNAVSKPYGNRLPVFHQVGACVDDAVRDTFMKWGIVKHWSKVVDDTRRTSNNNNSSSDTTTASTSAVPGSPSSPPHVVAGSPVTPNSSQDSSSNVFNGPTASASASTFSTTSSQQFTGVGGTSTTNLTAVEPPSTTSSGSNNQHHYQSQGSAANIKRSGTNNSNSSASSGGRSSSRATPSSPFPPSGPHHPPASSSTRRSPERKDSITSNNNNNNSNKKKDDDEGPGIKETGKRPSIRLPETGRIVAPGHTSPSPSDSPEKKPTAAATLGPKRPSMVGFEKEIEKFNESHELSNNNNQQQDNVSRSRLGSVTSGSGGIPQLNRPYYGSGTYSSSAASIEGGGSQHSLPHLPGIPSVEESHHPERKKELPPGQIALQKYMAEKANQKRNSYSFGQKREDHTVSSYFTAPPSYSHQLTMSRFKTPMNDAIHAQTRKMQNPYPPKPGDKDFTTTSSSQYSPSTSFSSSSSYRSDKQNQQQQKDKQESEEEYQVDRKADRDHLAEIEARKIERGGVSSVPIAQVLSARDRARRHGSISSSSHHHHNSHLPPSTPPTASSSARLNSGGGGLSTQPSDLRLFQQSHANINAPPTASSSTTYSSLSSLAAAAAAGKDSSSSNVETKNFGVISSFADTVSTPPLASLWSASVEKTQPLPTTSRVFATDVPRRKLLSTSAKQYQHPSPSSSSSKLVHDFDIARQGLLHKKQQRARTLDPRP